MHLKQFSFVLSIVLCSVFVLNASHAFRETSDGIVVHVTNKSNWGLLLQLSNRPSAMHPDPSGRQYFKQITCHAGTQVTFVLPSLANPCYTQLKAEACKCGGVGFTASKFYTFDYPCESGVYEIVYTSDENLKFHSKS